MNSDDDAFREAMSDVAPLKRDKRVHLIARRRTALSWTKRLRAMS